MNIWYWNSLLLAAEMWYYLQSKNGILPATFYSAACTTVPAFCHFYVLFIWTLSQNVYHMVIVIWDHFCTGDESAACKSARGDYDLQNSTSAIARWFTGQNVLQPKHSFILLQETFTVIILEHLVGWQVLKPWLQVIHSKLAQHVELLDMVPTWTYRK